MQRAVILAVLAGLLCAAPVRAEGPAASAKDLYLQGQKYYDLGEFERAIELFKRSYEVEARPQLLFNIAQAYRFAGNPERAHFFYNAFLRNLPKAPNRAEVEKFIAMMAEAMKKLPAVSPLPSPSPSVSPSPEPSASPSPVTSPAPSASPVAIPPPDRVAAGTDPSPTPSTPAAPADRSRPIYKKWWFWAGIGALAAGTVAVVVVTSSGGGVDNPSTDFPTMTLFN